MATNFAVLTPRAHYFDCRVGSSPSAGSIFTHCFAGMCRLQDCPGTWARVHNLKHTSLQLLAPVVPLPMLQRLFRARIALKSGQVYRAHDGAGECGCASCTAHIMIVIQVLGCIWALQMLCAALILVWHIMGQVKRTGRRAPDGWEGRQGCRNWSKREER